MAASAAEFSDHTVLGSRAVSECMVNCSFRAVP